MLQGRICFFSFLFFLFFLLFGCIVRHMGSQFPNQGSNPHPLQWKHRVSTTGPPGKSQNLFPCLFQLLVVAYTPWPIATSSIFKASHDKLSPFMVHLSDSSSFTSLSDPVKKASLILRAHVIRLGPLGKSLIIFSSQSLYLNSICNNNSCLLYEVTYSQVLRIRV